MFKKAQVVMLPTNEKATSIIMLGVMPNVATLTKDVLNDIHDWMKFGKPQHLYILSDDVIKEGDWFYHGNTGISLATKISGGMNIASNKGLHQITACKKIIATTDNLLIIKSDVRECGLFPEDGEVDVFRLPQPSQSFIEKYVEEYNKGNQITDVLVKYFLTEDGMDNWNHLKINPKDNTITIHKNKDSWSREEVIILLEKHSTMIDNSIDYEAHSTACCNVPVPNWDDDAFIKENL